MPEHSSRNFVAITLAVLALGTVHHPKPVTKPASRKMLALVSYPDCKPKHRLFGDLASVVDIFHMDLTARGKTEELLAGAVRPNFFQAIGVEPLLGRTFANEDLDDHVVVLGYGLWQRDFHRDTRIVGRKIRLEGEQYQVIGVLPEDFRWNGHETDVWVPATGALDEDTASYLSHAAWTVWPGAERFLTEI